MFAVTHKRLGGYLSMLRPNPSSEITESVPWLRKTLKPDATFATREEADALRKGIDDFDGCYEVVEVEITPEAARGCATKLAP